MLNTSTGLQRPAPLVRVGSAPHLGARDTRSFPARAFAAAMPLLVVWLPVILTTLYVKWRLLVHEGFRCVGRLEGRTEIPNVESRAYLFSLPEHLSFFRWDLLAGILIVPALALALCWLRPRWRVRCTAACAILTIALLALQLHGYWYVGQFQNWQLWCDAINWAMMHPDDAQQYGSGHLITKVTTVAVAVLVLSAGINWANRQPRRRRRWIERPGKVATVILLLATAGAWAAPMRTTAYHRSTISLCATSLLGRPDADVTRYAGLDRQQIMQKWREVSRTPAPLPQPAHFGAARDCDVICFIMETAPARCLDVSGPMEQAPNMRLLRERSFVGTQHVSSYPYTRWATFSLMTSWYPTETSYLNTSGTGRNVPGMLHSLARLGYVASAYKPYPDSNEDELLQHCEGVSTIQYADRKARLGEAHEEMTWRQKAELDHGALKQMQQDIARWTTQNQRYVALFLPQIGHAPWPDVIDDGDPHTAHERGKAIIALQDQWLGEVVRQLREAGRLERTIILLVGDHGIRTKREDPDFEGGTIDSYSFRVPFLLYVPQVLTQPAVLPHMTSHIDLGPSVLDLLGVRDGRELEMGAPIWDQRLVDRKVYLWANAYLGADGFHDSGRYGMWHRVSEMAYVSSAFEFGDTRPLQPDSEGSREVIQTLTDAMAVQYRVTRLGTQ